MRIASVKVEGYRCIESENLNLGQFTALVGSGGVGKSAFLRAIDWCINEQPGDERDLYRDAKGVPAESISITATFTELTAYDRAALGRYGVGDRATLVRSWKPEEEPKLSGSAYFYPPFDEVRAATGREIAKNYGELYDAEGEENGYPAPKATVKADVLRDMDQFEMDHWEDCELRPPDSTHFFGFAGGGKLRDCFNYVLVGATEGAPDAFAEGRGSTLGRLLESVGGLDDETQVRLDELQAESQEKMAAIFGTAREGALETVGEGITRRVQDYIPGAEVTVSEELGPPRPPDHFRSVQVRQGGGYPTDIERQGHGLQRALVIALVQELAAVSAARVATDDSGEAQGKSLMLAIEEPELYQHPLQARAVAAALLQIARPGDNTGAAAPQIVYSSHSEHFVRPALFEDLRIVRRPGAGATSIVVADAAAVQAALEVVDLTEQEAQVRTTLSSSLSQAVFAKGVVLCEGKTDAALLEAVARQSRSLEQEGIAVALCYGKAIIPVALAILKEFDIPSYVLFDADRQAKDSLTANEKMSQEDRDAQIAAHARKNARLLTLCGEEAEDWPDRGVRACCANFAGNLESDIAEIWPELAEARDRIAAELGIPSKSEAVYLRAPERAGEPPEFFVELLKKIRGLV